MLAHVPESRLSAFRSNLSHFTSDVSREGSHQHGEGARRSRAIFSGNQAREHFVRVRTGPTCARGTSKEYCKQGSCVYSAKPLSIKDMHAVNANVHHQASPLVWCRFQTKDLVGDGIEEQTEQVMKNIGAILEEAGTSFEKVLKTTVLIMDMGDFAKINAVYGESLQSSAQCLQALA